MQILISGKERLPEDKFPSRAHADDAGIDLLALESVVVPPGQAKVVSCSAVGLADFHRQIAEAGIVNPDCLVVAGFVWDKSGLAGKGITVLGGVIDKSYTDHILVVLYNTNVRQAFRDALSAIVAAQELGPGSLDGIMAAWDLGGIEFSKGNKVAQLIVQDVWVPTPSPGTLEMIRAAVASDGRREKGFGSSGA